MTEAVDAAVQEAPGGTVTAVALVPDPAIASVIPVAAVPMFWPKFWSNTAVTVPAPVNATVAVACDVMAPLRKAGSFGHGSIVSVGAEVYPAPARTTVNPETAPVVNVAVIVAGTPGNGGSGTNTSGGIV